MFQTPRYQVTGESAVLGHEPGSFFEDDLAPDLEARMIARGSLRRVPTEPSPEPLRLASQPDEEPADAALEQGKE